MLLRLAARGDDRRAGIRGRVSLHGVPTPDRLALWRQHLFPERAGADQGADQDLRARQRLGARDRTTFLPQLRFYRVLVLGVVPDGIGIAFGAFADPSMPWPKFSVWETARHPWVTFAHELDHFVHQPELIEDPVTARW